MRVLAIAAVILLAGCGAFFYDDGDLPGGGSTGTGGNAPYWTWSTAPGGQYANDVIYVSLFYDQDASATIYYSTNGATPRPGNADTYIYTGSFLVSNAITLQAVAAGGDGTIISDTHYSYPVIGTGDSSNPYIIQDSTHLYNVRYNLSSSFRQQGNIDLGGTGTPIGDSMAPFTGTYDGDYYYINNMIFTASSSGAGLFGIAEGAAFMNIRLGAVGIISIYSNTGALCGILRNGSVKQCSADGSMTVSGADADYCGGLIGYSGNSSIEDSHTSVQIENTAGQYVGGLVGMMNGGSVNQSSTSGATRGVAPLGGLVGYATGSIYRSFSTGSVSAYGTESGTGGLVGVTFSSVKECFSSSPVEASGLSSVGGLIGTLENGSVRDSYSTGDPVTGTSMVGGLVGNCYWGDVSTSYSIASVSDVTYSGAMVGYRTNSTFTDCYYNSNVYASGVGYGDSTGITGYTDAEMYNQSTYVNWDFSTPVWSMGGGYPYLSWQ